MARVITPADLANANRLKAIYNAKKRELDLTQTKLADKLGMKQGAVAQYINGSIALNYEAVIEFAKVLKTEPWNIDPTLNVLKPGNSTGEREVVVNIEATLSGTGKPRNSSITIRYGGMTEHIAGYEADNDSFAPFLRKGDIAVIDKSLQPEPGDDIIVRYQAGASSVGELVKHTAKAITIQSYADQAEHTIEVCNIVRYDVIVSVEKQKKNRGRRISLVSEAG